MSFESDLSNGLLSDVADAIQFVNEQYDLAKRFGSEDMRSLLQPCMSGYKKAFLKLYDSEYHVDSDIIDKAIAEVLARMGGDGSY